MTSIRLPERYEPESTLGKGGGGEVWSVRDRYTGARLALKVLAEGASERERAALVREAVALSGLEGLGVPRVVRFGRLAESGRAFMLRELVEGESLEELIARESVAGRALAALARAADQLTVLHRAGLLHGDVKPANIIVQPSGRATLVDLGLAAPWRESGSPPEGLTPKYAAPELFQGKSLTVRAEVYALGVALDDIVTRSGSAIERAVAAELARVAARATSEEPSARFPSADEFSTALRRAARLERGDDAPGDAVLWPIVGIDGTAGALLESVRALPPGETLSLEGPPGSGRSALMRRLAWSLGVEGAPMVWIDDSVCGSPAAIEAELASLGSLSGVAVLVDDAGSLARSSRERILRARTSGARLVLVGATTEGARVFTVPPLERRAATDLVRRAIPSLTARLLDRIVDVSGARPGELRRLVRALASEAVASEADIERLVGSEPVGPAGAPFERALEFLDRGRFTDARAALSLADGVDPVERAVAEARLELGLGEAQKALEVLSAVTTEVEARGDAPECKRWALYLSRAHVGAGEYARAKTLLASLESEPGIVGAEALAFRGLAETFLGEQAQARVTLATAVERARAAGSPRVEAVAFACAGLVAQREDRFEDARDAYASGIAAAERASDAGMLATLRLNLAGLLKVRGEIAGAIEHFEAAVDMGRRSGRRSTVLSALLNLANTDLYLGRLARARESIEALVLQRAQLAPVARAQLVGLEAEYASRAGDVTLAARLYDDCAEAWERLGRGIDSAEARLEGLLLASRSEQANVTELRAALERAREALGDVTAHRPLFLLASARVTACGGDEAAARGELAEALEAARAAGQKEWIWRALEARATLEDTGGQPLLARRDREEALAVLEDIGARLPRDLREVYWNDARRRQLRDIVPLPFAMAPTDHVPLGAVPGSRVLAMRPGQTTISSFTSTPLEQRLARILEINAELAGEVELDRLGARVIDHAVELLRAEQGLVLMVQPDGSLNVHTSRSRAGDAPHAEFSRSIAETVIATREPIVTLSARDDARMTGYASVHELMLQSVACVPILAPSGPAIGALYLETRHRPGAHFERELPTLRAFADQVAIALETARLLTENRQRAVELESSNRELAEAQARLRELLGDRTEQLKRARRRLRDARETLLGHFGYQGLVGTSEAMRRVYALIERVKDTDIPVLITGESGTGKEVVARAIHAASSRAKGKFLGVNCGAIPENLLESELFGHVRGAFTGADRERRGLLREAEGGSVLLDEIGEMPQKMQAGLLRVLQERKVRPIGGANEEPVDVRLIFATHRDLERLVADGAFREDLYYRIHVVEVRIPPLRERAADIPQLVDHFLKLFAARYKRDKKSLSRDALRRLSNYDWPGNVRQLEHVLLNAWVLSEGDELEGEDLELPDGRSPSSRRPDSERRPGPASRESRASLSEHRESERARIMAALESCNWNRVKAAELSGIPRRTFYRRLREYGIQ
ncbi:MAG: sigma 54-interacting transcriptional regulator [Sorangiineae bacterium]|nr:sigma 54-interacting transcriptional regulator [Polyangiaceae bacterium]MEB2323718.1 sigma 54-interacting transcriptional regulator [Sorangiineae bacterium]